MAEKAMNDKVDVTQKDKVPSTQPNICDVNKDNAFTSTNNVNFLCNANNPSSSQKVDEQFSKQYHIKDLTLKKFFSIREVFKDFMNGYFHNGKTVITEDNLEPLSNNYLLFGDEGVSPLERDVYMKVWNFNKTEVLAAIGIENQTEPDYRMHLRIAGYDGCSYRSQYEEKDLHLVATVVINYSSKEWGKNKLNSLLDSIPRKIGDEDYIGYCSDLKINVLNLKSLKENNAIINYGNGDLRLFFEIVHDILFNKDENHKDILNTIFDNKKIVLHYPTATALTIQALTGCDTYKQAVDNFRNNCGYVEGEPVHMCDILGNYINTIIADKDTIIADQENIIADKDTVIADKDTVIADKENIIADKDTIIAEKDAIIAKISAEKDTKYVTYLVEDNKTNEEIKKIISTVDDDFINNIRNKIKR